MPVGGGGEAIRAWLTSLTKESIMKVEIAIAFVLRMSLASIVIAVIILAGNFGLDDSNSQFISTITLRIVRAYVVCYFTRITLEEATAGVNLA